MARHQGTGPPTNSRPFSTASAALIARTLRRTLDASSHLCAVLASSHDDLLRALRPDLVIRCDFGRAYAQVL